MSDAKSGMDILMAGRLFFLRLRSSNFSGLVFSTESD